MPSIGRFLDMLEAISRRDWSLIESVCRAAVEEERQKKHFQAAHKISEALEIAISRFGIEDSIGTVSSPLSSLIGAPPDLLQEIDISEVSSLVLTKDLKECLGELIGEWRYEPQLKQKGLAPRRTILLHGPPGCGKSHLAKYFANALKMRLFIVRFDALISSYLGETGTNIRNVFDFVSKNRCILFIDELDAIAKLRDDKNELGELKRVVISLLQNLDLVPGRSIVIAATNHPHMLDLAIWRRFEVILEMFPPKDIERIALFELYLDTKVSKEIVDGLIKSTEGMSGSDILQICNSARRRELIAASEDNLLVYLFISVLDFLKRSCTVKDHKIDERRVSAAICLKKLDEKKFSFQDLEIISDISHSTLHNRYSKWIAEQ